MTRDEFNKELMQIKPDMGPPCLSDYLTDERWELIDKVYTYHPSICDSDAMRKVALLYAEFGFGIFTDLEETAHSARELEREYKETKDRMDKLKTEIEKLKNRCAP